MGTFFGRSTIVLIFSAAISGVIGAVAWSGDVNALAASFFFPVLIFHQPGRLRTLLVALAYYGISAWPLVHGAQVFFGAQATLLDGLGLWSVASSLLAMPWVVFHFQDIRTRAWCAPLPLLLSSALPPLAMIGWASPLTAAGVLFPGSAWFGIAAVVFLPPMIALRPGLGLPGSAILIVLAHALYPGDPQPTPSWQAMDTVFGGSSWEAPDPLREFESAEWIQERARTSTGRVIFFPETVVPHWNDGTELFWDPALKQLCASGKTVVFGAVISESESTQQLNAMIVRGYEKREPYLQRIPVPLAMWKPWAQRSFGLHLSAPGTISIAGERAAVLICYELLLTWPILTAAVERPTILIGVANDYWAKGTRIPAIQRAALTAWARLFRLPKFMAVNT